MCQRWHPASRKGRRTPESARRPRAYSSRPRERCRCPRTRPAVDENPRRVVLEHPRSPRPRPLRSLAFPGQRPRPLPSSSPLAPKSTRSDCGRHRSPCRLAVTSQPIPTFQRSSPVQPDVGYAVTGYASAGRDSTTWKSRRSTRKTSARFTPYAHTRPIQSAAVEDPRQLDRSACLTKLSVGPRRCLRSARSACVVSICVHLGFVLGLRLCLPQPSTQQLPPSSCRCCCCCCATQCLPSLPTHANRYPSRAPFKRPQPPGYLSKPRVLPLAQDSPDSVLSTGLWGLYHAGAVPTCTPCTPLTTVLPCFPSWGKTGQAGEGARAVTYIAPWWARLWGILEPNRIESSRNEWCRIECAYACPRGTPRRVHIR